MSTKDRPEKLSEILEKSLKRLDLSSTLEEYRIWPVWNETVGPTIARNAQPEKIRQGTLFVRVASPTWMQQLQYMKEMIAASLNQKLRREVVKNIFFFIGKIDQEIQAETLEPARKDPSVPKSAPDPELLRSIKDPEIRRALRRLYAAFSQKGKKP